METVRAVSQIRFFPLSSIGLRVRPETLRRIAKPSEHEADRGEVEEGEGIVVAVLPVFGEPAAAVEPGNGALNDPTLGLDDKALGAIGTFDDLHQQTAHHCGGTVLEDRACIGAVGEQLAQEWELPE